MKINCLWIFLICSVHATAAVNTSSHKLWALMEVTKDGDYGSHHFSIRDRQVNNLEEIVVVIDAKDRPISPFMSSELSLSVRGSQVALIPISEKRTDNSVSYKFRVAYSALGNSVLMINEGAFTAGPEGEAFHAGFGVVHGKPVRQIMGGNRYQLDLANFVPVHTIYSAAPPKLRD